MVLSTFPSLLCISHMYSGYCVFDLFYTSNVFISLRISILCFYRLWPRRLEMGNCFLRNTREAHLGKVIIIVSIFTRFSFLFLVLLSQLIAIQ